MDKKQTRGVCFLFFLTGYFMGRIEKFAVTG